MDKLVPSTTATAVRCELSEALLNLLPCKARLSLEISRTKQAGQAGNDSSRLVNKCEALQIGR